MVGGKGAGLFRMAKTGIPVPPFFVVTVDAWRTWRDLGRLSDDLKSEIMQAVRELERATGKSFGGGPDPLLVSVRSAGPVSMPGMMDTVLNLGLTPASIGALFQVTSNLSFVSELANTFLDTFSGSLEREQIPVQAEEQLFMAVERVFSSWDNDRARLYRTVRGISHELGTAVVVQAMVYGNRDALSGTGVLFTRDPASGDPKPRGEWLAGAQGEALVAGRVTPNGLEELKAMSPATYEELINCGKLLEQQDGFPQDVEFTVEGGKVWVLQTRRLRLSPLAACRVTMDMLSEGIITEEIAAQQLKELDFEKLYVERVEPGNASPLASGIGASPGVASGIVVRSVPEALQLVEKGERVVLVRPETTPNDLAGMKVASAIVTEQGGFTCHAAIVARELRIPCVVGCGSFLDQLPSNVEVTVDGSTGHVYEGRMTIFRDVPQFVAKANDILCNFSNDSGVKEVGSL
jgi:pyruvate,orthophosphate dikinase